MLTLLIPLLAAAAIPPPPPPADGSPPPPLPLHIGSEEMTCPVGGERFTATTTNMYSILGRRPDGKPYSEIPFPRPIPECPGNGLVVFGDFTPTETAKLAKWVETPVYQSMRKTESPFYRAYWLEKKVGRPDADAIEQLLPAIWSAKEDDGADPKRPRTARYQRVLVDAVQKLPPGVPLDDRIWLESQAANALREMGKFDAAEKMLEHGEAELPRTMRPALATYIGLLRTVIARRDRSDEPLDMIPDVQAAIICKGKSKPDPFDRGFCAQPKIASIVKQIS